MNKYVIYPGNNSRLFLKPLLDKRGNWIESETQDLKASFIWKPVLLTLKEYSILDELYMKSSNPMIHNHLENNREITTKTGLIRSLRQFYSTHEPSLQYLYQVHDSIATSFIITANYEDMEYQSFMTRYSEISSLHSNKERTPAKHCLKNMWLIKPAALNQGKGIEVCRSLKEIVKSFRSKPINSMWIIQKYIEKPLLFKGRKFDIRIWAIATGKHEFFYYKHGYLRTSSSEYDTQGTDTFIHLTNNCLQKYGDNYGAYEKGNTLSFDSFQEYLDTEFPQYNLHFQKHFLPRIKDLMIDSYLSARKTIHKSKRKTVFEFLGFDFLIDEDFRVWLIEANTNPYLGVPNEYIEKLLPNMLDDLLEITLDHYIPPRNPRGRVENDFELLFAEHGSAFCSQGINQRQSYSVSIYPVSELYQPPLFKQCIPSKTEEEQPKIIVRDLLSTVKHALEFSLGQDMTEINEAASRVLSQIANWELLSEEQMNNSLQALKLISGSPGSGSLIDQSNINILITMVSSENLEDSIQHSILESIILACQNMRFRKEIVKKGLVTILVNFLLCSTYEALKECSLKALTTLCVNPTKGIYIPGKSREHICVKERLISEGGILALLKFIGFHKAEEKSKESEEIAQTLFSEFHLSDWDTQILIADKSLVNQHSFPKCLDNETVELIKVKLECLNSARKEEKKAKIEIEKAKRIEKDEEKRKKELIIHQQIEEKRLKAEEYINKRYEEIRREKVNELKKKMINSINKFDKAIEDKLIEEKRHALLLKLKRAEEIKLIQELKIKQQEQSIRIKDSLRKKRLSDKKKFFLQEFARLRNDFDKGKLRKRGEDKEKSELDQIFNKMFYNKKKFNSYEINDDSVIKESDIWTNRLDCSKVIEFRNRHKKSATRRLSPLVLREKIFKIYGIGITNAKFDNVKQPNLRSQSRTDMHEEDVVDSAEGHIRHTSLSPR